MLRFILDFAVSQDTLGDHFLNCKIIPGSLAETQRTTSFAARMVTSVVNFLLQTPTTAKQAGESLSFSRPKIKKLCFAYSSPTAPEQPLTDDNLIQFLSNYRDSVTIESLDLTNCTSITSSSIYAISRCCPNLNHISLLQLKNETPEAIDALKASNPGIKIEMQYN